MRLWGKKKKKDFSSLEDLLSGKVAQVDRYGRRRNQENQAKVKSLQNFPGKSAFGATTIRKGLT